MKGASKAPARRRFGVSGPLRPRAGTAAFLAVLLGISGCAYFNTFYHAKQYYGQAEKAQANAAKGKASGASDLYKKAIDKCQKVIEEYPGSKWQDDAHLLLAKAYYGRGDYLSAENTLDKFVLKFPDSELYAEAMEWKGRTAYAKEDYEDARRMWGQLLTKYPKYENREEVEFQMAEALWQDNREDEAEPALSAFLQAHSNGDHAGPARLVLGRLYLDQKKYQEAADAFTEVSHHARDQEGRREAQMYLGEALEAQGRDQEALDLYQDLATSLDPDVFRSRLSTEDLALMEQNTKMLAAEQARQDSLLAQGQITGVSSDTSKVKTDKTTTPQAVNPNLTKVRNPSDPRDQQLAQVLLREGRVRARLGKPWDALDVFNQVRREFPRTPYAAEAQFRIGYTYEVTLENLDQAQQAYSEVAKEGASAFRDEAARRAKNLSTVKNLLATASRDSLGAAQAAAAEARFMRAELYLFQQENPTKAAEEYHGIETEFAGSEFAAKAGLALAWVASQQGDSAAAAVKYAEVAEAFPNTEYGRRAGEILHGPEPEPESIDFVGPSLDELRSRENLASLEASLPTGPDTTATGPTMAEKHPTTTAPVMTPPAKPLPKLPEDVSLADFVKAARKTGEDAEAAPGTTNPPAGATMTGDAGPGQSIMPPIAEIPPPPVQPSPTAAQPAGAVAGDGASPTADVEDEGLPSQGPDVRARIPDATVAAGPGTGEVPTGAEPGGAISGTRRPSPDSAVGPLSPEVPMTQPGASAGAGPGAGRPIPSPAPDRPVASHGVGLNPLFPVVGASGDSAWTPRRYTPRRPVGDTVPGHLMDVPRGLYLDPMASPKKTADPPPSRPAESTRSKKPNPSAKEAAPSTRTKKGASAESQKESAKEAPKETPKEAPKDGGAKADSTSGKGDR